MARWGGGAEVYTHVGLLDRIRGDGAPSKTAEGPGAGIADRLGSIARRGGEFAGRVADGVKDVTPKRILRDAIDAQARGNLGAAYFLARESVEAEPGDPEADAFFWDVAIEFGEPGAATESAARLVHHHAGQGATVLAAQFFRELVSVSEPALVEPQVLVRMLPDLVEGFETARAEADAPPRELGSDAPGASHAARIAPDPEAHRAAILAALRMCVHPENTELSPGLAMRVAELARPFDESVSLAAAHQALTVEDIHEAKRAKLVALIRELDPDAELEDEDALEVDEADLAAVSIEIESGESDIAPVGPDLDVPLDGSLDAAALGRPTDAVVVPDEGIALEPMSAELAPEIEAVVEPELVAAAADAASGERPVAADPITAPISEAEADRLTSFLEPEADELQAVAVIGDITESEEVDALDVLPELEPIDESDPSRNHPSRVESPAHQALSDDEVDRMRARIERALGSGSADDAEVAEAMPLDASDETRRSD